jgi:hypothetical protein
MEAVMKSGGMVDGRKAVARGAAGARRAAVASTTSWAAPRGRRSARRWSALMLLAALVISGCGEQSERSAMGSEGSADLNPSAATSASPSASPSSSAPISSSADDSADEAAKDADDKSVGASVDDPVDMSERQPLGSSLSCAQGGACRIGDRGPGGGAVFSVGRDSRTYYEVAPAGWSGSGDDPRVPWCGRPSRESSTLVNMNGGLQASNLIRERCPGTTAASRARDYRGGGKDDWHLPAMWQLSVLYDMRSQVGMDRSSFWSATTSQQECSDSQAIGVAFTYAAVDGCSSRTLNLKVRPVREFT